MYAELSITSNFTFLTGASHPEEYMERAVTLGLPAIVIADDNSVAGIVRAHTQAREIARKVRERLEWEAQNTSIGPPCLDHIPKPPSYPVHAVPRLIPAARLIFTDAPTVTALPLNRQGWANLCRILSKGRLRAENGDCILHMSDLLEFSDGLHLLLWPQAARPPGGADAWRTQAQQLTRRFGGRMHLLRHLRYDGADSAYFSILETESSQLCIPTLASATPLMHHGARRKLADVVTAIRLRRKVDELGREALANGEQRLRSKPEMLRIFKGHEDAVTRTHALSKDLKFSLGELRYEYPSEGSAQETPTKRLHRLAHEGVNWRYPEGASDKVQKMLAHELTLIKKLKYEPYFLTVHNIVKFARSRDILCQGRGSAANSVVCYCLRITEVGPEEDTMVFERFVSEARDEPPDIDVDFDHERREEDASWLTAARGNGYHQVDDVWRRAGLRPSVIERLAEADAFAACDLTRREALWQAKAIATAKPLPLFSQDLEGEALDEPEAYLPQMTLGEQVVEDYVATRLSLKAHPVALLRHLLTPDPRDKTTPVA
nr:PHP domain-containing protein [Ruegeria atlantica]